MTSAVSHANSFLQSGPVCSGEVVVVVLDTGESVMLGGTDMSVEGNSLNFTTGWLTVGRHYNITVTAYNVAGMATAITTISK